MKNKEYIGRIIKRLNRGYISLRKKTLNSNLVPYLINIKNNINSNSIINNEISIKDVLINMLTRTNNIYDIFQLNVNNLKLDNDECTKRSKIIRNIKDFIANNIYFNTNNNNFDNIFCNVIYFFDLLIIQNKKYNILSTFEKLGLGALILILKFNKLQEKILIKKYKSIFNDKYMTLEEINKIEVLSLKLINYYIIQPNLINYINFLDKNIFINNKCRNVYCISKSNISILKSIMSFSNNYIKYHPFYLSCFIIKYCYEQNKTDGFQKTLIDYFDINMRTFRTTYEEFINNYNNQLKTSLVLERQQKEENKSILYKIREFNSDLGKNLRKYERYQSSNKYNKNTINNSILYKSCKKDNKKKETSSIINLKINPMNNTYYKKFLDNYLTEDNNEYSDYKHQNQKTLQISDTYYVKDNGVTNGNKMNYTIESPKKCGILINYRFKKKLPEKPNTKLLFFNLKKIKELKKNKIKENIKDENEKKEEQIKNEIVKNEIKKEPDKDIKNIQNNDNIHTIEIIKNNNENKENIEIINLENKFKRLNSDLNNNSYGEHFYSIRKSYKNKNLNNRNIFNKKNNYLSSQTTSKDINIKILNNEKSQNEEKYKSNIKSRLKSYLERNNNFKSLPITYINNEDSNIKNTINQTESSIINNKVNPIPIDNKRVRKFHIRNFYKQKKSINLNFSNLERKNYY